MNRYRLPMLLLIAILLNSGCARMGRQRPRSESQILPSTPAPMQSEGSGPVRMPAPSRTYTPSEGS